MIRVRNWLRSLAGRIPRSLRRFVTRYFMPKFLLSYLDAQAQQGKKPKREQRKQRHKSQQDQARRQSRLAYQLAKAMWAGFGTCAANKLEAIEFNGRQPAISLAMTAAR